MEQFIAVLSFLAAAFLAAILPVWIDNIMLKFEHSEWRSLTVSYIVFAAAYTVVPVLAPQVKYSKEIICAAFVVLQILYCQTKMSGISSFARRAGMYFKTAFVLAVTFGLYLFSFIFLTGAVAKFVEWAKPFFVV